MCATSQTLELHRDHGVCLSLGHLVIVVQSILVQNKLQQIIILVQPILVQPIRVQGEHVLIGQPSYMSLANQFSCCVDSLSILQYYFGHHLEFQ